MRVRTIVVSTVIVVLCPLTAGCHEQREGTLVQVPAGEPPASPGRKDEPGRKFSEDERWSLTHPQAVKDLRETAFGEKEIDEFWTRKGWRVTKREERYLAEVQALVEEGAVTPISRWFQVPYAPVYQALRPVRVLGTPIQRMQEFALEFCDNEDEVHLGSPRFARAKGYQEEHADGHATDPSAKKHARDNEEDH